MRTGVLVVLLVAASAPGEDGTLRRAGEQAHAHRDDRGSSASGGDRRDGDDDSLIGSILASLFGGGDERSTPAAGETDRVDEAHGRYRPLRHPYAHGGGAFVWIPPIEPLPSEARPASPATAPAPATADAPWPPAVGALADRPELRAAIARLDALDGDDRRAVAPAAPPAPTPRDAPIDRAGRGVDVAVRVGVDGARIENDLARFGLEARAVLPWRLDVEARARWYHESLAGPDADLWLSGLDLGVRALQFENVAARVGVGARWLHDDGGDEGGGVVSAALDIYPVKPVLIEASAGAGVIGGASLRELRLGAGAVIGAAEIAAGWERVAIGTVPLDGPYLALRWWL